MKSTERAQEYEFHCLSMAQVLKHLTQFAKVFRNLKFR